MFNGQHSVMDMTGQAYLNRLFNRAFRGKDFIHEELEIGNMFRTHDIRRFDEDFLPGPELDDVLIKPNKAMSDKPLDHQSNPAGDTFNLAHIHTMF